MSFGNYVKTKQPLVYRTFSNAFATSRLAHAYLLLGEAGTPLKETALYLAKSILCDNPNPLADEECRICQRIERGEYPDFRLFDGSEASIKKDSVSDLVQAFQQTALERKGIMVYVIHQVENMTVEAINGLLKFLEEPTSNTYAILTTQNEAKVLPTIVSRCEKVRLLLAPRQEVIQEAIQLGVEDSSAQILSYFYNSPDIILNESQTEEFQAAKQAFSLELEALAQNKDIARFTIEKDVAAAVGSSKQSLRFYFDMLSVAFEDAVAFHHGEPISLKAFEESISAISKKIPNVEKALEGILTLRGEIERNINATLLLAHLITLIYKE